MFIMDIENFYRNKNKNKLIKAKSKDSILKKNNIVLFN